MYVLYSKKSNAKGMFDVDVFTFVQLVSEMTSALMEEVLNDWFYVFRVDVP